ncbi:NAD(P)/FAD-dependent oxidoreductase [Salipiger pentaromativorans]|uniref:NAD(P)/FAD-dependent oxidoreductase n=1 Tax=Salipiger pentaromativorans TaxID=2943193 RepID=UPI00215872B5|nr:FAD-binding oxidoreductase [Salipiger pentaromativorans]
MTGLPDLPAAQALPATADVAVIGGGLVGAAVAWGLLRRGLRVVVLDEGDLAYRASRGNFGLVWVQGKGLDFPPYAHLTRDSADAWPGFDAALTEASGVSPMLTRAGGYGFCFSQAELDKAAANMARLAQQTGGRFAYRMVGAEELRRELPWIGPEIPGAVHTELDRGANPLYLLRGLHLAIARAGGVLLPDHKVTRLAETGAGYTVETKAGTLSAGQVVLAAGLGNAALAPMVGLTAPVRPVRGQILVTERIPPFLNAVTSVIRQMHEGSCLIGATNEEAGYDTGTLPGAQAALAAQTLRLVPALEHVRIVRSWGALRVMTPDGLPIYDRAGPGAWLITVHSGVTLAPMHCERLSAAIAHGALPEALAPFSASRLAAMPEAARAAH